MLQLTSGRWDKNRAGSAGMNLRVPISQKQFLYVGYTHLERLLTPSGASSTHTAHGYRPSLMKCAKNNILWGTCFSFIFIFPASLLLLPLLLPPLHLRAPPPVPLLFLSEFPLDSISSVCNNYKEGWGVEVGWEGGGHLL